MFYIILRIIFFILLFIIISFLIIKSKIIKKKRVFLFNTIICIILCSISYLIPVENLFINFKTPQKVFNYYGTGDVYSVFGGENSSMILSFNKDGSYTYPFILKTQRGYKIPSFNTSTVIFNKRIDKILVEITRINGTNDNYIKIIESNESNKTNVSDNKNSTFKVYSNQGFNLYFAYINNFDENYYIYLNNEKILIE